MELWKGTSADVPAAPLFAQDDDDDAKYMIPQFITTLIETWVMWLPHRKLM